MKKRFNQLKNWSEAFITIICKGNLRFRIIKKTQSAKKILTLSDYLESTTIFC